MACGTLEEDSMFAVQPDLLKAFFPEFVYIQSCSVVVFSSFTTLWLMDASARGRVGIVVGRQHMTCTLP